jgi:hypothetical protein
MSLSPAWYLPESRTSGVAFDDWPDTPVEEYRSGMRQPHSVTRLRRVSLRHSLCTETPFLVQQEEITDPNAQTRDIQTPFPLMARNLLQLAQVAKAVIPELRDMTAAEHRNLRGYYKQLYRKA